MDTERSDEGQFSTPRAGARQAGYSSASDNEGDGGQGYSSARSWTSDNEYGTPRNSGNMVSSDSEVDGFYSGREQDTGYGSQRDRSSRTVHMPYVAGGNVPHNGNGSHGYKSSDNGGYSSGGGGGPGYYPHQQSRAPPQQQPYQYNGHPQQYHHGSGYNMQQGPPGNHGNAVNYDYSNHPRPPPNLYPHPGQQQHYDNSAVPSQHGNSGTYYPPSQHQGHMGRPPPQQYDRHHGNVHHGQAQPYYGDHGHHQQHGAGRQPPQQYEGYGRPPMQQQQYGHHQRHSNYDGGGNNYQQHPNDMRHAHGSARSVYREDNAGYHQQPRNYQGEHAHVPRGSYGAKFNEGRQHGGGNVQNRAHGHNEQYSGYDSAPRSAGKKESSIGNLGSSQGGVSDEDIQAVLSAARHGRVQEVGAYLDQGVPVNIRDKFGNTILAIACQNGLKKMAKLALRRGADINSRNYKGNTPLHFCFTYGYGDTLGQYLISKGADPSIKNHQGTTCYEGLGGSGDKKK